MIKKGIAYIVLFLMFTVMCDKVDAASSYFTTVEDNVPVYDNRTGKLVEFGYLVKGQSYQITKDYGVNWYQIKFGSFFGYVPKEKVTSSNMNYKNANTKYTTTNQFIKFSKDTLVYDNSSGNLVQFAMIKQGQSLAILYTTGNWFAIDIGGRIGYVHNSYAQLVKPTTTVQGKYLEATQNAPLYDNRRGNLDKIAELIKGQQVEMVSDYGKNWWKVKWGNGYAYIEKNTVVTRNSKNFKNVNATYKTTKTNIIPKTAYVQVADNTSGALVPFAKLEANHRYPIIKQSGNWYIIDIGGRYGYVHNSKVFKDKGIPVLAYHHILDQRELGKYVGVSTTITTEQFESEMKFLYEQGYETILMTDLVKYIKGQISLPAKAVAINFDDGLLSVKENAYPILQAYHLKATEYLITARIQNVNQTFNPTTLQSFSQSDVEGMRDVFDYQAHTHNLHNMNPKTNLGDLVTSSSAVVKKDLALNKSILNATSFSYPFGQYNNTTISILKSLNFQSAVTTKSGYVQIGDDPFHLKRIGIYQHTTLNNFNNIVGY